MSSLTLACGLNGGPGAPPQPKIEQRPTKIEKRIGRITRPLDAAQKD
jgi:hypothetical protein